MDLHAYLRRIGYSGALAPSAATLRELHRAHLLAVPFENLDIPLGRPVVLDQDALFTKIVTRRRGGFCYELNGLFAALLRELGFEVTLLSAGVARADGGFGPDFDHLALLVATDDRPPTTDDTDISSDTSQRSVPNPQSQTWLADVGFGDSFRDPLRLVEGLEQPQDGRSYRIERDGDLLTLMQHDPKGWEPQYRFTLQPRQHAEYVDMCTYHQTSPDSSFTRKRVCTLATPDCRVTLSDRQLIVTTRGVRAVESLPDESACQAALREHFGIELALI
jgi:N-hydroxyarylamine O-acetyltransferase